MDSRLHAEIVAHQAPAGPGPLIASSLRFMHQRPYTSYDLLQDPEIREGVKAYASWPTIPQLYVEGEFVGGCDIVTEMYASGELEKLVQSARAGDSDD